jgi:hypothetical protein
MCLPGLPPVAHPVQLCVQKLRLFVDDQDQNLKYLGLLALATVLKINPKAVSAHKYVRAGLSNLHPPLNLSHPSPGRSCCSALTTTMSRSAFVRWTLFGRGIVGLFVT